MIRWLSVLALSAVLGLTACGGDDSGGSQVSDKTEAADGPSIESVVDCLADAGLEAEVVSSGDKGELEIPYPNDTTKIEFLESAEEAEQSVEFGKSYDFEDFSVGPIYVLLGSLDEVALEDRGVIEDCISN